MLPQSLSFQGSVNTFLLKEIIAIALIWSFIIHKLIPLLFQRKFNFQEWETANRNAEQEHVWDERE